MMPIKGLIPLRISNQKRNKSLEKLSSGLHLNRSADGAAELSVSESMKAQIRGLNQAGRNATDGMSLIQTAEGALTEVHSMLNRMVELSTQTANGTYTDEDRALMQKEVDALKNEIDRIAQSTNYNGIPLLNGELASSKIEQALELGLETPARLPKPAQLKNASWEGEIDFSTAKEGATIKINDIIFEFDTDGNVDTGSVSVNIAAAGGNSSAIATAFVNAVKANGIASRLDDATATVKNGNVFEVKLTMKSTDVVHGESFTLTGKGVPNGSFGASIVEPGVQIIPGLVEFGTKVTVKDIDMNSIKDGMLFEVCGKTFEIDTDGKTSSGNTVLNLAAKVTAADKADALSIQFKTAFPSSVASSLGFFAQSDGKYSFSLTYKNYDATGSQPTNFSLTSTVAAPSLTVTKYAAAINTPVQPFQAASQKATVDFSKIVDGSILIIDGNKFEFDIDGELSAAGNTKVPINAKDSPMDIANKLVAAFNASGVKNDFQMRLNNFSDDLGEVEVKSLEPKTTEGQTISIEYDCINKEADGGIILQIGCTNSEKMRVNIESASVTALNILEVSVETADKAADSIKSVKAAINLVSVNRAGLGASYNRLEHTRNNLAVSAENLTAAEDRLSSADMAKEMMQFTKENIISQAAQSMLTQAQNLSRNSIQQLLQN